MLNKVIALVLSNGIVAISGALLAQFQGFSDINMGRGAIVIGLAAVIIGEVIFGKIFKNFALKLIAAVIGGVIYYIVITLVVALGLPANDLKLLYRYCCCHIPLVFLIGKIKLYAKR